MNKRHLIVINSGSSSIKFALYALNPSPDKVLFGSVENIQAAPVLKLYGSDHQLVKEEHYAKDCDYSFFFELLLSALNNHQDQFHLVAAGHRVVHGGNEFYAPLLITPARVNQLKKFIPFAPLHQPYNLAAIEAIAKYAPTLPQIACFDTAFHRSHPAVADAFAIPRSLSQEGIRRYGFHGLSYEFIVHQLQTMKGMKLPDRLIIAHLGNGASMCAIKKGVSVDSTTGFTALDGLMMGTRCGTIDPGVILYLQEFKHMSCQEIEHLLYKQSGLLGVSAISSSVKDLLETRSPEAKEALDLFVYRIRKELGALAAALGGLDMLVFTGGIGEHAWPVREAVCKDTRWLGIELDKERNKTNQSRISTENSAVAVYTIPTDEEWMIAHHCQNLLNRGSQHG